MRYKVKIEETVIKTYYVDAMDDWDACADALDLADRGKRADDETCILREVTDWDEVTEALESL